jgi:inhibitor of KinA sporulation pathway (predicted exonuclease)
MLIESVYIRNTHLVLRDVDGSEESMPLEDALDLLTWLSQHKSDIETRMQEQAKPRVMETWKAAQAKIEAELEAIQTDQDAYAFIAKHLSKDLQGRYRAIYRSDRHEMNRTPRQAIDNLLSLPPLE